MLGQRSTTIKKDEHNGLVIHTQTIRRFGLASLVAMLSFFNFFRNLLSLADFDFAVPCLILLDKVTNKDKHLSIRTPALIISDEMKLVEHII